MMYAAKMTDLLQADAKRIADAYGCELIHDNYGNYLALSEHQDSIEVLEIEVEGFFKSKGNS